LSNCRVSNNCNIGRNKRLDYNHGICTDKPIFPFNSGAVKALRGHKDQLALKVLKEYKDLKGTLDQQELKDNKAFKVLRDHQEIHVQILLLY
jgi:hypothetical protein